MDFPAIWLFVTEFLLAVVLGVMAYMAKVVSSLKSTIESQGLAIQHAFELQNSNNDARLKVLEDIGRGVEQTVRDCTEIKFKVDNMREK